MTAASINGIPSAERQRITERLVRHLEEMDEAEWATVARARDSLAYFVARLFKDLAALAGYVIALPIAWARTAVSGFTDGFRRGWASAL